MAYRSFYEDSHEQLNSSMNLIPMIDVMLVLLVIFILTAPIITSLSRVDLPKNNLLNEYSVKGESVQLAINKSGDIYFKGEIFPKNKWPLLFAKCINSEYSIVLNADRQLNVEKLLPILDELKSYNCENIFFATVQE